MAKIKTRYNQKPDNPDKIPEEIASALEGLKYGKIVINVQGGSVIFIDRYKRNRVKYNLLGLIKQSAKQKAMPAVSGFFNPLYCRFFY